jgi:hypothetical protein
MIMPVMRVSVQLIGLFVTSLLSTSYTYAYGSLGHEIVGEIATSHLCARAAGEVEQLLDGESLGRASRWPDWIRKEPKWRKSRPWHFINVADNDHISAVTGRSEGDVIWAIEKFRDELADQSLSDLKRAEALRFLAHFIADVHQPLHVGRYEDRGGNKVAVIFDGRKSNLHKFWDAQWLLKMDRSSRDVDMAGHIASINALGVEHSDVLQSTGVLDWARESKALRPKVYAFGAAPPGEAARLGDQYSAAALNISRERLAAAGIRLAGTLNDIFCGGVE